MAKRLSNLYHWDQQPPRLTLQLLALPLVILAALLLIDGLLSLSLTSLAIGVIGLAAAVGLQRHGQRETPEPRPQRSSR